MTAFIEVDDKNKLNIEYEKFFNLGVEACLDYLDCPYEVEVSLLVTDNAEIQEVNNEQRNMDKPTDVLSFPMVEWEEIRNFDLLDDETYCFHPDSGELMLGDIIVSWEKVEEQATEYGHSIEREFTFLIVHSMLHLFGYDHMVDEERMVMEQAQSEIMEVLGISR